MDLRDYFAGQVLTGLLANADLQKKFVKDSKALVKGMGLEDDSCKLSENMQYHHAMISYKFADAMIREKDSTKYKEALKEPAFDRTKMTTRDDGK